MARVSNTMEIMNTGEIARVLDMMNIMNIIYIAGAVYRIEICLGYDVNHLKVACKITFSICKNI